MGRGVDGGKKGQYKGKEMGCSQQGSGFSAPSALGFPMGYSRIPSLRDPPQENLEQSCFYYHCLNIRYKLPLIKIIGKLLLRKKFIKLSELK